MARYGLKKLLEMLLTLFIVVTLVFFLVRMIPGDHGTQNIAGIICAC